MNLTEFLGQEIPAERRERCLEFIDRFAKSQPKNRFIFGLNVYTKALIREFSINAIIDDTKLLDGYSGIPIITFDEFKSLAEDNRNHRFKMIVLSAVGGRPLTGIARLSELGVDCLDYFNFQFFSESSLPEIPMNENFRSEFEQNTNEFQEIYDRLEDIESKKIFENIISFRLNHDLNHLNGFTENQINQYFEPFLDISKNPGFVDVGCYDGFTTLKFIATYPNFTQIIAIEPEKENYSKCKRSFKDLKRKEDIYLENAGLSSAPGDYITIGSASTATVKEVQKSELQDHESLVSVKTLDQFDLPKYDKHGHTINWLIKMDIEGMEFDAIVGATRTIRDLHPSLAISVYHSPRDLWRIAKLVLSLCDNYKIYVRHYTESIYETVMFFVPRIRDANQSEA